MEGNIFYIFLDRVFHYMDYGIIVGFLAYVIPIEVLESYKIFAPYVVGIYIVLKTSWIVLKWLIKIK